MKHLKLEHPTKYEALLDKKRPGDFWPTPAHAIESLLGSCPPSSGTVVEPCAGNGAIARVLLDHGYRVRAIELQPVFLKSLIDTSDNYADGRLEVHCPADFLAVAPFNRNPSVSIVCNPPFSLAVEFADACVSYAPSYAALLLRLPILGSATWAAWLNEHPPCKIRPLKKRPSFRPDGKTEPTEYAWFVWDTTPPIDLEVV